MSFTLSGNVDDVDINVLPPCVGSAATFKTKFRDDRSSFTVPLEKWEKLGQNDRNRFTDFLSKTELIYMYLQEDFNFIHGVQV